MTIEDQIKDEKLQCDINREAAKISALSSGKLDKYEYLTGEEILPSNQQQIIQQAKLNYSPLEKAILYESTNRTYDFRSFKTIRTYGNDIRNNVTSLKAVNLEQANLIAHVQNFVKNTKPQDPEQKE